MALKTVTGKLTNAANVPIGYAKVSATLSAQAVITSTQEIASTVPVLDQTRADGTWSLSLESNLDLTPNTTYYTIAAGDWSATVVVPQTAGPFKVEDIMAAPPAVSPPAALDSQVVHLALPETITGVKVFSANPTFNAAAIPDAALSTNVDLLGATQTATGVKSGPFRDWGGGVYNVKSASNPSGAAVGDGTTDDTASIQAAFNAAALVSGKVVIPGAGASSGNKYKVTSTITIQPQGGGPDTHEVFLDITAGGLFTVILWAGADNTPVFKALGWKVSIADGIKVQIPATSTGVVAWELDVDVTRTSTGQLEFRGCRVDMVAGATNCRGWRMGHSGFGVGGSELSFIDWTNCHVAGNGSTGAVGWMNEHANGLNYNWFGGSAQQCATGFTNQGDANNGGGSMYFYGFGTSTNTTADFQFRTAGSYAIYGGRFESGKRWIDIVGGSNQYGVLLSGCEVSNYTPADNIVINSTTAAAITLDNCHFAGATAYTVAFLTVTGFTGQGIIRVVGGGLNAPDPFWTISGGTWAVYVTGVGKLNASNQATAYFTNRIQQGLTLTGAPDLALGTAASRIVPGATSLSLRNNGNSADNLILTDAGAATIRDSLTAGASTSGTSTIVAASGTVLTLTGNAGALGDTSEISFNAGRALFGYDGSAQLATISGSKGLLIAPTAGASGVTGAEVRLPAVGSVTVETLGLLSTARTLTITAGYASQRFNYFQAPTISAATSLTVTDAATVAIQGAPVAAGVGPAVLTRKYQLWLQGTENMRVDSTTGLGNGANTTVQAPVIGTGSGPANAVLVAAFIPIYTGATLSYIPVMR